MASAAQARPRRSNARRSCRFGSVGFDMATLRGPTLSADFKAMVIDYVERRYGVGGTGRTAAE